MEPLFPGKDYYTKKIVPKAYLEGRFTLHPEKREENEFFIFFLKNLHKIFTTGDLKGETLIDIGSGPTIYQFLSACESFREIIATDFVDQNREEMLRWLKKEPGAFDWGPVVKYVCELEGDREKWPEKEEKVRRAVKQILKCDVTQPNPLAPLVLPPADCVLSCLCLESACQDFPSYRSAMKNISSLVKPGGHLVLFSVLQEKFYMVGQQQITCLWLEKEVLTEAVIEAGFVIKSLEETSVKFLASARGVKWTCALLAQKQSS